ncbi:hypothetical protein P692DRAFT_20744452, partial [Suillus brevipes Sb2]
LLYLPPYSPDLNPIEESFSTLLFFQAYLRRHAHRLRDNDDPINVLIEACACITPEMCKGWFRHASCIID